MKKCPTCEKTFDDAMRFCQVDGTPLIDDAPFDPYATIVGTAANIAPAPEDPVADDSSPSQSAISVPEEILEAPNADPLKTMYVSDDEMQKVLGGEAPVEEIKADEMEAEAPVLEVPPMPEPPPPSFTDMAPPPSPFSEPSPANEAAVPAPPMFLEPEPAAQEADTVIPPEVAAAITPPGAPVQEWTPPPPPDASWQNQETGSNTPFQPPPAGAGGENKTLAIISLVCGILSLICCSWFIPGIAAIVMGFIARSKANSDPANYGGAGLAMGGIITGAISVVLGIIVIILYLAGALAGSLGSAF
ncbi:MAG: DUF4190 domain-containing protein [Pyrinomonadaceae bacterium]